MKRMPLVMLAGLAWLVAGCTSHTITRVDSVEVRRAEQELPQEALLDVGIAVFDPNVPEHQDPRDDDPVFPEVRKAEARYIPYQLRRTMERTNHWGAVRVLPESDPGAELLVTGIIEDSDGYNLELRIEAVDAAGRMWLREKYIGTATQFAYRDDVEFAGDPFQDVYDEIANDLLLAREKLARRELREIRTIAQLKYAQELSPQAFGDHLREGRNGRVEINRLPPPNDPMLSRVDRIRDSEYLFIDTVDQQYGTFYQEMDPSYDQWRRYSYEETLALQDVKRSARTRMLAGALATVGGGVISSKANNTGSQIVGNSAILGGLTLMKQGYDVGKEADLHQEALKELATSFDSEVAPIVMDVEGEVVKLSGSLQAQYHEWRRLLREIYAAEVGLPLAEQGNDGD